jgi:hypothetical protein
MTSKPIPVSLSVSQVALVSTILSARDLGTDV